MANSVVETIDLNARNVQTAFEAFGMSVATLAAATSATTGSQSPWPLVTIPNWQAQATLLANHTGSHQIGFLPLVTQSERSAWENYATQNFDPTRWLADELPADFIWRNSSVSDSTPVPEDRTPFPYYAPMWQTETITPEYGMKIYDMINRNGYDLEYLQRAMDQLMIDRVPIQTEVLYTLQNPNKITSATPVTAFISPVFEASSQQPPVIVGVIVGWLEWLYQFTNLLPTGVNGIIIVVSSEKNCQPAFSLQIDGPDVKYLGKGDKVDRDNDGFMVTQKFDAWEPVEHCGHYVFDIYPSEDFREHYDTVRPWIYSGTILLIFFIAFVVFLLYDWTVERHTENLETRAARTSAIVNSLFPANVRDRIMQGDDMPSKKKKDAEQNLFLIEQSNDSNRNADHQDFDTELNNHGNLQEDATGVFLTKPIADLFPEATGTNRQCDNVAINSLSLHLTYLLARPPILFTVMFADIVGFTAWSSTREPSQVFTLLETTYK